MSGSSRDGRHRLRVVAAAVVAVLALTGGLASASESSLGAITARGMFSRIIISAPVVPRMRMADSFTSGTFVSGRVPQDRQYLTNTWNVPSGNWSITAGAAAPQTGGTRVAIYDAGSPNVLAAVTLNRQASTDAGLIVRSNSAATTYLLVELVNTAGGSAKLSKVIAGTSTTLASATKVGALSIVPIAVRLAGASVSFLYNGVVVISYTLTAGELTTFGTQTSMGIWVSNGTSESFDDFYVASWPAT